MNVRKSLESRIRGWLPKEPALRTGNANAEKSKIRMRKDPVTLRERAVGGIGAAGGGLILSAVFFYFIPIYPKPAVAILLIAGISLLAVAIVVYKTENNR